MLVLSGINSQICGLTKKLSGGIEDKLDKLILQQTLPVLSDLFSGSQNNTFNQMTLQSL